VRDETVAMIGTVRRRNVGPTRAAHSMSARRNLKQLANISNSASVPAAVS